VAQERLAAGQAHFTHAKRVAARTTAAISSLLRILGSRGARGSDAGAIEAAQVTLVGHGHAQIIYGAAKAINEHVHLCHGWRYVSDARILYTMLCAMSSMSGKQEGDPG